MTQRNSSIGEALGRAFRETLPHLLGTIIVALAIGVSNWLVFQERFETAQQDVAENAAQIDTLRTSVLQLQERDRALQREREIENRDLERRLSAMSFQISEVQRGVAEILTNLADRR